ncbi:MAG: hypothetical protein AAF483_31035, partial [Planctomycetota bacterium]
ANSEISDSQIVEELYWSALSRAPSAQELQAGIGLLKSSPGDRLLAVQDIAWAIMNAKEFLFRN